MREKDTLQRLFYQAGIQVNGSQPYDIQVHNPRFYKRFASHGSIGLGESYMDGWWDSDQLDGFFHRILSIDIGERMKRNPAVIVNSLLSGYAFYLGLRELRQRVLNMQRRSRAFQVGEEHYDIGNEIFENMLDRRMVYSCGYWKDATSLDEAQEAKLDLVCRKIGLQEGMTVLDIGAGFGSFLEFAAERYGAKGFGVTVSQEQAEFATRRLQNLPARVGVQDYRDLRGNYDRIVSIGMFEHVGYKNYRGFMEVAYRSLKRNGLFLLHTIGNNTSVTGTDPWIDRYIFPNGMLPSLKQIGKATEGLFVVDDLHNFGADYDKTLMVWDQKFEGNWDKIKASSPEKYDKRFFRMWRYYLLSCAALFRSRKEQLWQIVLSKDGIPGGYPPVR